MLGAIVAILAGLLLLSDLITGAGKRFVAPLQPFGAVIGVIALVLGVLHITSVLGVSLVLAGLILAVSALRSIPRIGDELAKAGRTLEQVRIVIGVVVLIAGIMVLL